MTEPAVQTTDAEREPVKPVEQIMPVPVPTQKPVQGVIDDSPASVAADDSKLFVIESVREQAERNLAKFLGEHLDPTLTADVANPANPAEPLPGLNVDLKEHVAKGKSGIKLCLHGPNVLNNHGLIGQRVLELLEQHPSFSEFFANDATRPHVQDAEAGTANAEQMVHIHVPNLTLAQYAGVIQSLNATPVVKLTADVTADEQAAKQEQKLTGTPIAQLNAVNDAEVATQPATQVKGPAQKVESMIANDHLLEQAAAGASR